MKRFKRRRYIISSLQVNLLLTMVVYALGMVGALAALVFLPVALDVNNSDLSQVKRAEASALFLALDTRLWPAFALIVMAFGAHAVLLTHRIAGPLYRLRQVMASASAGDFSVTARLRKRDMLNEEAQDLNRLLGTVLKLKDEIGENASQIRTLLRSGSDGQESAKERGTTLEIEACLDRIQTSCDSTYARSDGQVANSSSHAPPAALPQPGPEAASQQPPRKSSK